jgi:hypothetical protein
MSRRRLSARGSLVLGSLALGALAALLVLIGVEGAQDRIAGDTGPYAATVASVHEGGRSCKQATDPYSYELTVTVDGERRNRTMTDCATSAAYAPGDRLTVRERDEGAITTTSPLRQTVWSGVGLGIVLVLWALLVLWTRRLRRSEPAPPAPVSR